MDGKKNPEERENPMADAETDAETVRAATRPDEQLGRELVRRAFVHGFEAGDRFADRPFDEIASHLRQSWETKDPDTPWDRVGEVVKAGYDRYQDDVTAEMVLSEAEALDDFPIRTIGGSTRVGGGDDTSGRRS